MYVFVAPISPSEVVHLRLLNVRFASFKSSTAAQQQRLIDSILEMPVR